MSKNFFDDFNKRGRVGPFRICGCGDPMCSQGPDYARIDAARQTGMPLNAMVFIREDPEMQDREREMRRIVEEFRRRMQVPAYMITGSDPAQSSGPPESYTEARKAIEEYLLKTEQTTQWDDVIGNETAKRALLEAIEEPVRSKDLYEFYGMKPPKGVLLYGPPGCGKTMFAKAAATAMSRIHGKAVEILAIAGPTLRNPWVGATERKIRQIFEFAREYRAYHGHPLVVFIDEAETLFPDRTGRTRRVAPWEESQVAQFLAEMDGMETLGAFVILASNRPEAIDEALLRDGRCDRKIKVERPNREAVEKILRDTLRECPLGDALETLVTTGAESFYNPHYVIHEGHIVIARAQEVMKDIAKNFCLEHIISGAMVAGVARRAKSLAFHRDRSAGTRSGIGTSDIVNAVKEIFEENRGLEHAYAMKEWGESLGLPELLEKEMQQHEKKGRLQ